MKRSMTCVLAFLLLAALSSSADDQQAFRVVTVYGPKAGFNVSAPEGWVINNESGKEQGMSCVLYPKGSSWKDAKTVMYANLAGSEWEGVDAFVTMAIQEMKANHGIPKE